MIYPDKNPRQFHEHFVKHMDAMTVEKLEGKGGIAVQLAWRDKEIEDGKALLQELIDMNDHPTRWDYFDWIIRVKEYLARNK